MKAEQMPLNGQHEPSFRQGGLDTRSEWYVGAMEHLITIVERLSHAQSLNDIMEIVRVAARGLTDADGATFVLRDGDKCFYAEENAISPLWKGQRFPLECCISGWVMLNGQPAVIEDIYLDPRIPADAYRPTFVKSLAMVPVRKENPVAAIGNYWATNRMPTNEELAILQALANVTSVAMENVNLYTQLHQKVQQLETSNRELNTLAWGASHDLKSPLRAVSNLSAWIVEELGDAAPEDVLSYLATIRTRIHRMEKLLNDIQEYVGVGVQDPQMYGEMTDGKTVEEDIIALIDLPEGFSLSFSPEFRSVRVRRSPFVRVLCNLIDNAVKHHDRPEGNIDVSVHHHDGRYVVSVEDDGPGIPEAYHEKIFGVFQTLERRDVKDTSGIGLAVVHKILEAHGGDIEVETGKDRGTAFRFNWPKLLETARSVEERQGA